MFRLLRVVLVSVLLGCSAEPMAAEDHVEFLNGTKVGGQVTEIRKDAREFDFTAKIGQRIVSRTYGFSEVHAVTYQGKRFVLTTMDEVGDPQGSSSQHNSSLSPSQLNRAIALAGKSEPEWFATTDLNYPQSLDLSWPLKVEGGWNNQKTWGSSSGT